MAETITQATLEERWRCATRDVQRFTDAPGIGTVNSDRWKEINDNLEDLAAFLVEETSERDDESLSKLTVGIWDEIKERTIAWAMDVERSRGKQVTPTTKGAAS